MYIDETTPFPFPYEPRLPFSPICKLFVATCRDANVFQASPENRRFYHRSSNPRKRKHWEVEPDGDATVYLLNRLSVRKGNDAEFISTQDMEHFTLATDKLFDSILQIAVANAMQASNTMLPHHVPEFVHACIKKVNEGVNMILNTILEIDSKISKNDMLYIENGQTRPGVRCEDINELLIALAKTRPLFDNYNLVFRNT
jgi:hypothetical protein